MQYSIKTIARMLGAEMVGDREDYIKWILIDSRSLSFPEETLFFALKTRRGNGADYIPDLYQRGVNHFVVSKLPNNMGAYPDCNFLVVPDTKEALQKLAQIHRDHFQIPVIGVTGSNGKTIVKEWLHQILSPYMRVVRSPRSYNSQVGVPLSIWQMSEKDEVGVFEAGISRPDEMEKLEPMIRPTVGVFTSLGGAHQENFFSMQEKCMEKLRLFKHCDVVIYNADNQLLCNCVACSMLGAREIAWSTKDSNQPLYISSVKEVDDHTSIKYSYLGIVGSFDIPFQDEASITNAIHCLAVALYMMLTPDQIAERMAKLEPVGMRLELKEGKNHCQIINDSYNSDLASLDIALDFLMRRSQRLGMQRTLILSDIMQSGHINATLYRRVGQLLTQRKVDKLIAVGPNITKWLKEYKGEKYFFMSTEDAMKSQAIKHLSHEVVLVKGARQFHFERITDELQLRQHETILEVNLNNLVNNLNSYRAMLSPKTKMVSMVKASGYGAGTVEVAKTLQEHRTDYLAVALADEGVELRQAGVFVDIIVMNPEMSSFSSLFQHHLEPEVYSFELLDALLKAAQHMGIAHFPIHVKINTGMNRLGFLPSEIPELIERLKGQTALIPRSVFSHLAGSDDEALDSFTKHQIALFDEASTQFISAFNHKILRHLCNSAGIVRFPEAHYDMVRLGLGLYGIDAASGEILQTVCSLYSTILQIRDLPAGETVGYNKKGVLVRPSRIAAIPVGYADGIDRRLGNGRGYCLVNGQPAPYVGNICMDVCMIDVTDISCEVHDKVELFGENLPVTQLAKWMDTIPYEVLTSISSRVKRVSYSE